MSSIVKRTTQRINEQQRAKISNRTAKSLDRKLSHNSQSFGVQEMTHDIIVPESVLGKSPTRGTHCPRGHNTL